MTTADGGPVYSCAPNTSGTLGPTGCAYADPATGNDIPADCGKMELCSYLKMPCDCSATSCSERVTTNQLYIAFDLVISGSRADGTISGALGDHAVHFVRAQ
ncbi:MAG: hypothetical protein ACRENE_15420 [Polyangiaceae bacterium]